MKNFNGAAMKVLIVDDNQDILDLFKDLMGDQYTIITARNGQEAIDLKDSDKDITVVLTDIQMPVMNGFQFIEGFERIKGNYRTKIENFGKAGRQDTRKKQKNTA